MIPSLEPISEGQIGKICELISTRLRKTLIQRKPLQIVLETEAVLMVDKIVTILTNMIRKKSDYFIYRVIVNRKRPPINALLNYAHKHYESMDCVNLDIIKEIPYGKKEGTEDIYLFYMDHYTTNWESEYEVRGLKPADLFAIVSLNDTNYPLPENITRWKGKNGQWCYCSFCKLATATGVRAVVSNDIESYVKDSPLHPHWLFVCVRKL